jgi:hypothetical protein
MRAEMLELAEAETEMEGKVDENQNNGFTNRSRIRNVLIKNQGVDSRSRNS